MLPTALASANWRALTLYPSLTVNLWSGTAGADRTSVHEITTGSTAHRGVVELAIPRAAAADEAVWLQVQAGVLPRGAGILISIHDGTLVGKVSPLAVPYGANAGTYTVPLPGTAIANGRVHLRLAVEIPGAPARDPKPGEVQGVYLMYVPITR